MLSPLFATAAVTSQWSYPLDHTGHFLQRKTLELGGLWNDKKYCLMISSTTLDQRATATRTAKKFRLAKQQLCTCITLFCTFLSRRCTTTEWQRLISRFVEDGNRRQQLSFPFPELWYSPKLEFNSNICLTKWIKPDKVWGSANCLFNWRFRCRSRGVRNVIQDSNCVKAYLV